MGYFSSYATRRAAAACPVYRQAGIPSRGYVAVTVATLHPLLAVCTEQTQAYARQVAAQRIAEKQAAQQVQSRTTSPRSN
jgi:hypothetical protein